MTSLVIGSASFVLIKRLLLVFYYNDIIIIMLIIMIIIIQIIAIIKLSFIVIHRFIWKKKKQSTHVLVKSRNVFEVY